jgi:hypothetical protein
MHHCHCGRCRKAHGTSAPTYLAAPAKGFRWRAGQDAVAGYESSPGFRRCFCPRCGSVVPGTPFGELIFIPAGDLDGDPGARPEAHIFAAAKAPWSRLEGGLPAFDAFPPGIDAPVLADLPRAAPPGPGPLRGSCLCGAVAFAVEGPLQRATYCHCQRCRKARSAAFATNLVTRADGVRLSRGEEWLRSYRVPEARFFTQVFCGSCGSPMPRIDPGRGIAVVPMGALDDDPALHPERHIFVGSKAPWDVIADGLPQFEEYPPDW